MKRVPYVWSFYFDKCPIHYTPKAQLVRYLVVRGYQLHARHGTFKIIGRVLIGKDITIFIEGKPRNIFQRMFIMLGWKLCFWIQEQPNGMHTLFVRCTYAVGNLFCAHMLGLIPLCGLVQRNSNWNDMSDIRRHMPTYVLQNQYCSIPVEILLVLNKRKQECFFR